MAQLNERRGWEWDQEERDRRKSTLRKLKSSVERIEEQVRRVKRYLPEYSARADAALKHLLEGLGRVVELNLNNRGRKYLPVSPGEMDRIAAMFPELIRPWEDLVSSPDYTAALRSHNKQARAINKQVREHNRIAMAQMAAAEEQLRDVFERIDQGDVGGALDIAAKRGLL